VTIFGIDPGSDRTGYGCVETDGSRHVLVASGAIVSASHTAFPDKLLKIHTGLADLIRDCRPDCVAIENVFHGVNPRSALRLGHARGVAMLAAVEAGVPVFEYAPAEIKRAVVGRAEKHQVQQMVTRLLRLTSAPTPHDAADALAVAICHAHSASPATREIAAAGSRAKSLTSWRHYRPARP
jgi:crossover junction endodeoxyribonuclease RuvC